jgi:chemotaxis signal transduction protein
VQSHSAYCDARLGEWEVMMQNNTHSYLMFRVRHEWYAITVDSVIEVLHLVALNEVPEVGVLGMMTLRNRPVKGIDLRQLFGLPNPDYKMDNPIIAVNTNHGAIGLVVDEAESVAQVMAKNITVYDEEFIEGVFRFQGRMVFIVKLEQIGNNRVART